MTHHYSKKNKAIAERLTKNNDLRSAIAILEKFNYKVVFNCQDKNTVNLDYWLKCNNSVVMSNGTGEILINADKTDEIIIYGIAKFLIYLCSGGLAFMQDLRLKKDNYSS